MKLVTEEVGAAAYGPVDPQLDRTDIDSLHRLPLGIIPLKTGALRRHALIKNAQLNAMVELFRDDAGGSGQVRPDDLCTHFGSRDPDLLSDIALLKRLAAIGSYDVYTLRVALRDLDIGFERYDCLRLSEEKYRELTGYMRQYTRPILRRLFARDQVSLNNYPTLVSYLRNPDRAAVLGELEKLAGELETSVGEIPHFLENYGDTFLGFAYFRSCLGEVETKIRAFNPWVQELLRSPQAEDSPSLRVRVSQGQQSLQRIVHSIHDRFRYFDESSAAFWQKPTADSFRALRKEITAQHSATGAVLCGLVVKFNLWSDRFRTRAGGYQRRLEFMESEMLPGLSALQAMEEKIAARYQR